jgi:hypothetical protein
MTRTVKPKIETVQAFIGEVRQDRLTGVDVFYRGTDMVYPTVSPSLFRSDALRNAEKDLFNSMLATHPYSFREDTSSLDKLVRMQHHGLPTRLLDITSNPLVALYFASALKRDDRGEPQDGEVVRFMYRSVDVKYPDSDHAAVMANLARLTANQRRELNTRLSKDEFNNLTPVKHLLHFIKQEKPYFEPVIEPKHINSIMVIRGKQSNARIIAQAGAFLLFGEKIKFEESPMGRDITTLKFLIEADAKEKLRKELDQLNINERTLFPSLETTAKYLKAKLDVAPARR